MSDTIKPVAWMCPVDDGDGPDISCNWEYASLFKGKADPLYSADALATLRKEKDVADSFYAVAMADLKMERATVDRLREENQTLIGIITIHGEEIKRLREELDDLRIKFAAVNKDANREVVENHRLREENERLREELAAAQKDAERYRYLNDKCRVNKSDFGDLGIDFACDFEHWDNIDAAIDAAMAKEKRDE